MGEGNWGGEGGWERAYCIVDNPFDGDENSKGRHDCVLWWWRVILVR